MAAAYLWLGVEHILFGVDHLLFVLALIILVRGWKRIALTVTAFTVAHSITLAAATLGFVNVPGPPVEAAIALSIALVAVEIVNSARGRESLTARLPWLVAFAFGLLHGLGFAGALSEVGLPGHAIPVALLFFNIGVELGQLLFIAGVMASVHDPPSNLVLHCSRSRQADPNMAAGRRSLLHRRRRFVLADRAGQRLLGIKAKESSLFFPLRGEQYSCGGNFAF